MTELRKKERMAVAFYKSLAFDSLKITGMILEVRHQDESDRISKEVEDQWLS